MDVVANCYCDALISIKINNKWVDKDNQPTIILNLKQKIKRDFILSEQELRIELNQVLLNKQSEAIQFELSQKLLTIDSDKELMLIENKYIYIVTNKLL